MAKILVLYYSSYGHTETMAQAVAEGARGAGGEVDIRRIAETAPAEVVREGGFKTDHDCPELESIDALGDYDGIVMGTPTRFGRVSSQMAALLDQAGGLWMNHKLVGKVGAAFTSTASQHGGQETTLFSMLTNMLHFGMTVVGLDYGYQGQMGVDEVHGGTPYGASTIAAGDGSRSPSDIDLDGARYLGRRVAETAAKLCG